MHWNRAHSPPCGDARRGMRPHCNSFTPSMINSCTPLQTGGGMEREVSRPVAVDSRFEFALNTPRGIRLVRDSCATAPERDAILFLCTIPQSLLGSAGRADTPSPKHPPDRKAARAGRNKSRED